MEYLKLFGWSFLQHCSGLFCFFYSILLSSWQQLQL